MTFEAIKRASSGLRLGHGINDMKCRILGPGCVGAKRHW